MYRLPIGGVVAQLVDWLLKHYGNVFDAFSAGISEAVRILKFSLNGLPWWWLVLIAVALAWRSSGWRLALGTFTGLFLVYNLQLWTAFMDTLVLVLLSTSISVLIGVPLGIVSACSSRFRRGLKPILDFMQTMPSFVYLIPSLMFFGLGIVPAVIATVVFSMPPAIRFTDLGLVNVSQDMIEVGQAFGSNAWQLLWKIQIPLAWPTIMAGVNQTIMLSLSMVVIAAMIGAGRFGQGVLAGISQMDIGKGFENGLAVVELAMIMDRLSQSFLKNSQRDYNQ